MYRKFGAIGALALFSSGALAQASNCHTLPSHADLEVYLKESVQPTGGPSNGGLDFHMWGTIVAPDGTVCAVAKTGEGQNGQWLGSRAISAQKANTANAFSLSAGSIEWPGRPGIIDGKSLLGRAAGREPVWPTAQQPGRPSRRLRRQFATVRHPQRSDGGATRRGRERIRRWLGALQFGW